ncbi:peptidoglycan-binding protein [Phaeobacter sp. S60]|uniref:peptidoglycan-binding domain-containing protein n=1 Tax=Phaeobacter sp. S60 TaxID=1569353 RepID=UPI0005910CDB|nr:peptidoglycan-binding domain-containing protein [Phaeobacter sp. S60]KII11337.1 hypothetical protein OO25_21545 [Phaeobacter sp. S60]
MKFTTRDIQARCAALGFHPGPIDGRRGPRTSAAIRAALEPQNGSTITDLFHKSGLHRVHMHWTAGAKGVIEMERRAYNSLVTHDGQRVQGLFPPEAQASYAAGRAASHTRMFNTGAIGHAMDAMAGAIERPFDRGSAPITLRQLDAFCRWAAEYSAQYWIPVNVYGMPTHAEIQPMFGVRQRWKWDITWLPGMSAPGDPSVVGERLRDMIRERLPDVRAAA